jgi:RNA polymerase subunit RPABC4/transcription elongation factor Spt4
MGGGILFFILFALILLPIVGVSFWYPFSDADTNGRVNYRSTETLNFNEFWYEYENIEVGGEITFSVDSSSSVITFAIWDRPFESIPLTSVDVPVVNSKILPNNEYWVEWLFLRPDSSIDYEYNASDQIHFFIADGNDFYWWDPGTFFPGEISTNQSAGSRSITYAADYNVVWYNDGGSPVTIDYTVNYTATGVTDFSGITDNVDGVIEESVMNVNLDTFTVPTAGNWYFFVYFDPMNAPEESTTITFDVTYDTGITARDRWLDIQWILIIILVVVIIVLTAAVIARIGQKKLKLKEPEKTPAKGTKGSPYKKAPITELNCIRCGASLHSDSKFCPKCGGKVEGRQISITNVSTPANAKTCSLCGSKLTETEKFCKWCGTKIEDK